MSEEQAPYGGRPGIPSPRSVLVEAPWCKMPMELAMEPSWSKTEIAVYAYLDWRAGKRGWFYESQQAIVEATGVSIASVKRAIASLKEHGFIEVDRTARDASNMYYIRARLAPAGSGVSYPGITGDTSEGSPAIPLSIRPQTTTTDPTIEDATARVWEHFRLMIQPQSRKRPAALSKIKARLKTNSEEELIEAINRFHDHPWWMEHNSHQGAEWFFFDDAKIERWRNLKPPVEKGGGSNGTNGRSSGAGRSDAATRQPSALDQWS